MTLRSPPNGLSSEPGQTTAAAELKPVPEPPERVCRRCSSPLGADQEWCLECGAASTPIRTSPDWRIPVAIVVTVIAVAVAGFIVALSRL